MELYKFEKESSGRWYIVLPEWDGEKAELEMVCGADTMLDILAQGESEVFVAISDTPFENQEIVLEFDREEDGGGWYNLKSNLHEFPVWLCHVTKFVFGKLPQKIYAK